jgi:prevent-host-death family protein
MSRTKVSVHELRTNTCEILRRAQAGEWLRVTEAGRPVAQIGPLPRKRRSMPFDEFLAWRDRTGGADPELPKELRATLTDTTGGTP